MIQCINISKNKIKIIIKTLDKHFEKCYNGYIKNKEVNHNDETFAELTHGQALDFRIYYKGDKDLFVAILPIHVKDNDGVTYRK